MADNVYYKDLVKGQVGVKVSHSLKYLLKHVCDF